MSIIFCSWRFMALKIRFTSYLSWLKLHLRRAVESPLAENFGFCGRTVSSVGEWQDQTLYVSFHFLGLNERMCNFYPYLASAIAAPHYYSPWRTLLFILNVFREYRVLCLVQHAPKRATCLWPVLPCRYPSDMQAASLRPLILSIELLRIVFIRLTARNTLLRVTWQSLL